MNFRVFARVRFGPHNVPIISNGNANLLMYIWMKLRQNFFWTSGCSWPLEWYSWVTAGAITTEANAAAASKLQHVHDADKTALVRYVLPLKPPCLDAKDSYPTSYPILTMGWGELMSLASGEWLVTMVTSSKMSISGSRSS